MFREKLDQFCCLALNWLTCRLAEAHELIFLNPRTTAKGIVCALALVGAHFGFHLSAAAQGKLAAVIALYLGFTGRDRRPDKQT